VYIEYRQRLPGIDLALFHNVVAQRAGTWSDDNPEDISVLNIARTWRLGPEPEYLSVSWSPGFGVERLGDWDCVVRSGSEDIRMARSRLASRISRAGCFLALLEPVPGLGGPYYVEFWELAKGRSRDDVRQFFERRVERHSDFVLHLVADRVGRLGPDPRGIAAWGIGTSYRLPEIAEELAEVTDPVTLVDAGLYEDVGGEIL
jgi:hypothetical protein